jgi:hypothetical protein
MQICFTLTTSSNRYVFVKEDANHADYDALVTFMSGDPTAVMAVTNCRRFPHDEVSTWYFCAGELSDLRLLDS